MGMASHIARCPARSIRLAAYFTRGSGKNEKALYTERPEDYEYNMVRLARKFETAKTYVPKPVLEAAGDHKIGIIAYGTSHFAVDREP